jgi:UTP--glucose-1-phosphate uridylyltransferase
MGKIKKAVIPAAGLGTRFLPVTKAMPKEMLPIIDKPAIQYIVEEAVQAGIEEIIIVTGRNKRAIEDHFDRNCELETNLKEKNKTELLRMVEDITNLAEIHYVRQKQALGLGHAVWCARKFIGKEPFAVLLGDILIDGTQPCLKQLMDVYEERRSSVIAVQPVPWEEVSRYGVINTTISLNSNLHLITGLVEKPTEKPPSNLAVIGRYILDPTIFDILDKTQPGLGNEIQLTDALRELAFVRPLYALEINGNMYDVGDKLGFLKATVQFASNHDEIFPSFEAFLNSFMAKRRSGN